MLKMDSKIHTNVKNYKCDGCHQKFKCTKSLNRHKLTHTVPNDNAKPICSTCYKTFTRKFNLIEHISAKHSKNSYPHTSVHHVEQYSDTLQIWAVIYYISILMKIFKTKKIYNQVIVNRWIQQMILYQIVFYPEEYFNSMRMSLIMKKILMMDLIL